MNPDLARLLTGTSPDREAGNEPTTGRIVNTELAGVYVAPLDGDNRYPVGPCRGARRRAADGTMKQLPIGTVVLLVWTNDGPWVAAADD